MDAMAVGLMSAAGGVGTGRGPRARREAAAAVVSALAPRGARLPLPRLSRAVVCRGASTLSPNIDAELEMELAALLLEAQENLQFLNSSRLAALADAAALRQQNGLLLGELGAAEAREAALAAEMEALRAQGAALEAEVALARVEAAQASADAQEELAAREAELLSQAAAPPAAALPDAAALPALVRRVTVVWSGRPPAAADGLELRGSFDGWRNGIPLAPQADGRYAAELLLYPAAYDVKFVLDRTTWLTSADLPLGPTGENNVLLVA